MTISELCSVEGCTRPIAYKKEGLCAAHYQAKRREAAKPLPPPEIPEDLAARASVAKTAEDWQGIAASLAPVMQGILEGSVKATAAQASLIKDVWNRAYGKPVATQSDKKVAAGIVILPTLGTGEAMQICPNCGYNAVKKLENDPAKEIALRQFVPK